MDRIQAICNAMLDGIKQQEREIIIGHSFVLTWT